MDDMNSNLATVARKLALSIAVPALDAHSFKLSLDRAPGPASWLSLRKPTIQAALAGIATSLDALRSAGAFDGSAAPTTNSSWGVIELTGGSGLPVGAGRARIDFMPAAVLHGFAADHIFAPPLRDPRFAKHCLAFATMTIFKRAGAAHLAKRAARSLLTNWIDKQMPFAVASQGPLAGLASLAEGHILAAQVVPVTTWKRSSAL